VTATRENTGDRSLASVGRGDLQFKPNAGIADEARASFREITRYSRGDVRGRMNRPPALRHPMCLSTRPVAAGPLPSSLPSATSTGSFSPVPPSFPIPSRRSRVARRRARLSLDIGASA